MPLHDPKKRKACQSCKRSKAKCSPSDAELDICYRCHRLNKECIFEDTVRKRAPKTRSRFKQLEKRVDTIIDLLVANGPTTSTTTDRGSSPSDEVPEATVASAERTHATEKYITPVETPNEPSTDGKAAQIYDPIETGLVDRDRAIMLLDEFKESFVPSFPFVVVTTATDVDTLRRCQPFLFLAIMSVMTYTTPSIRKNLSEEFKNQIASRIICQAQRSIEILQGLLVYGGWYHFFYRHQNQQMGTIVQLCVAMVQDLGLTRNPKEKAQKCERTAAEKRAFLGTYYLTVTHAQVWRKRGTMPHTKFMTQCYQSLADQPEYPTDTLIAPLCQLSYLITRVSDYFSYDDIDNADISQGGMLIEMATSNFGSELERIKGAIPALHSQNLDLNLKFTMLEMWIHESSLHSTLWRVGSHCPGTHVQPCRLKMLHRIMSSLRVYADTFTAIPRSSLYHLSFSAWAGWFYLNIVACNLVFLQENDRLGQSALEAVPSVLHSMMCSPHEVTSTPGRNETSIPWDPTLVAREAQVQQTFEKFINNLETHPTATDLSDAERKGDTFSMFVRVQGGILNMLNRRLKECSTRRAPQPRPDASSNSQSPSTVDAADLSGAHSGVSPGIGLAPGQIQSHPIPAMSEMHFDSLNFDSIQMMQESTYEDWAWDLMADFTMPLP